MNASPHRADHGDWLELPPDITASIFRRLSVSDILTNVQLVCSTWHKICSDPSMWRSIGIRGDDYSWDHMFYIEDMCKHAVDMSSGGLLNFDIEYFGTDELLCYVADRSSKIKELRLFNTSVSDEGLTEAARKMPLLEVLDISHGCFSKLCLAAIGHHCPSLKTLKFNGRSTNFLFLECDEEAFAIAEYMPSLMHLQIIENKLTDIGLQAILDGCPHLESLDLRRCFNVRLEGRLEQRCMSGIRHFRHPYDSTYDYRYKLHDSYLEASDDDVDPYWFSDTYMSESDNNVDDNDIEFSSGTDPENWDYYFEI